MNLYTIMEEMTSGEVTGWAVTVLILFLSLIQISPIRLNPWDAILRWIGTRLTGGIQAELKELKKEVKQLWVNSHRQSILTFARECRAGMDHSSEEWTYILNLCGEYEEFCQKNEVVNGVIRENMKYIRDLFHELSRERKL